MPPAEPPPKQSGLSQLWEETLAEMEPYMAKRLRAQLEGWQEEEAKRRRIPEAARPRGRTTPIAVRFDEFTLTRLRALAARRNTGYQTLLKEFVVERLYEEEKREGIIE